MKMSMNRINILIEIIVDGKRSPIFFIFFNRNYNQSFKSLNISLFFLYFKG